MLTNKIFNASALLQEGSDNRSDSLRYRCPDVHTGKQDQQFLLLCSVAVCDRMRTDLSGNECDSSTMLKRAFILRSRLPVCISPLAEWVCFLSAGWLVVSSLIISSQGWYVIMGYIADTTGSMAIAFLIPLVCYGVIGGYVL